VGRMREALGEGSPDLADALASHAKLMLVQQRWDEAEAALREAEAIHAGLGGPAHARALTARGERALVAIGREQWKQAERELQEVAALRGDGGRIEASTLASEAVALAYAACRSAPAPTHRHLQHL